MNRNFLCSSSHIYLYIKQNAIIRLHGRKLNGKRIKVEPITDFEGQNRVRVPGKIVAYVLGYVPKEDDQTTNDARTSTVGNENKSTARYSPGNGSGNKANKRNNNRNGAGTRKKSMFERLSESDQQSFGCIFHCDTVDKCKATSARLSFPGKRELIQLPKPIATRRRVLKEASSCRVLLLSSSSEKQNTFNVRQPAHPIRRPYEAFAFSGNIISLLFSIFVDCE